CEGQGWPQFAVHHLARSTSVTPSNHDATTNLATIKNCWRGRDGESRPSIRHDSLRYWPRHQPVKIGNLASFVLGCRDFTTFEALVGFDRQRSAGADQL